VTSNSESSRNDGRDVSGTARADASSVTKCRYFRVTGRVQGVFFRDSTREQALKLQLTGLVRNMPDGSVEVFACGRQDALEQLGVWLQSGPPMASVANVESADVENRSFRKFTIG
jgi:acylphosphatase